MGKSKTKKAPRSGVATHTNKQPAEAPAAVDNHVSYRFGMCDDGGDWPWSWEAFNDHLDKLTAFETRTWADISGKGAVGACRIPLKDLPPAARQRLQRIKRDDIDALWEMRVGNKPRFWGQRIGGAMCFIWWDGDHTVFHSTNRHRGGN